MSPTEPGRVAMPRNATAIPFTTVIKPGGGTRTLAILDREDEQAYACAVARVVPAIESALGAQVIADRAVVVGSRVMLGDWRRARSAFHRMVRTQLAVQPRAAVFVGDVRSCFPSIRVDVVERALRQVRGRPVDIEQVLDVLHGFRERGVVGLPVGPAASAPLANVVLMGIDDAIRAQGVSHLRWVDDVVAFCDDVTTATRVADAFHRALARVGLHANPSKTMIVADRDHATHRLLGDGCSSRAAGSRAMLRAP